jgi:hypothetical protein
MGGTAGIPAGPTGGASAQAPDAATGGGGRAGSGGRSDGGPSAGAGGAVDASGVLPAIDCKSARFCDDFEAYAVGAAPAGGWTVSKTKDPAVTLVVASDKAWSGTKSISIHAPGASATAFITRGKPVLPLPDGDNLFGRMMTFLTKAPPGPVHWNSMRGTGRTADGQYATYSWGAMNDGKVLANYNEGAHDCWKGSRTLWPVGKWSCLQWQFDGSKNPDGTVKNEMRIWVDGVLLSDAVVSRFGSGCTDGTKTEWTAPLFDGIRLGWENYQTSSIPIEMWLDDVALDSKPIACPAK